MSAKLPVCIFCEKFNSEEPRRRHPVFDAAIYEDKDFVVVPAVGSFVEGYLLVIPREHYLSLAQLPAGLLSKLTQIISNVRAKLSEHFSAPVLFEHGLVCQTNRAGSCVDHAHLHCVPLAVDITPRLASTHALTRIDKIEDITSQKIADQSYIYFENQKQEKFIIGDAAVPSQYLRRIISAEIGLADLWDWAAFPFERTARATLRALSSDSASSQR